MFKSLSGKVLLLSIIFVLLGEVLIFLPSIANYRVQWFKSRIAQAEIAALASEASPDKTLNDDLRAEILKGAGVIAVSLKKGEARQLMLRATEDTEISESFDLRSGMYFDTVLDAIKVMFRKEDRVVEVIDIPPNMSGDTIEVAVHEEPLRKAMFQYGLNILGLSIALSLVVAGLIFAALNRVLVRPMQQLTQNMIAFGDDPQNLNRVITPSDRSDEIGTAERELHDMQEQLQASLKKNAHLASLGLAVSKVSHDLRNMLTSAQLISDRLGQVQDPTVLRFTPKLMSSLDRAITFLNTTLVYGRAEEKPPLREHIVLQDIVSEVFENIGMQSGQRVHLLSDVAPDVVANADREQLTRIITNLVRNANQAVSALHNGKIMLAAQRNGSGISIQVTDNGPGIPIAIRDKLFEAFQTADRPGGTGLGLAISAELVRAHGGQIDVAETGPLGTTFQFTIPDK